MIKLAFIGPQREVLRFDIENRIVRYYDKIWIDGIQWIPLDLNMWKKLKRKGGDFAVLAALMMDANIGDNKKEYESCNTDEEIAEMIKRDCKIQGMLEVK